VTFEGSSDMPCVARQVSIFVVSLPAWLAHASAAALEPLADEPPPALLSVVAGVEAAPPCVCAGDALG
jgi:hypothetical protein